MESAWRMQKDLTPKSLVFAMRHKTGFFRRMNGLERAGRLYGHQMPRSHERFSNF